MMRKFQIVWLIRIRITIVLKLLFSSCERFQNGTRAAINFSVKLKKTVTETLELLKSAYGEECLSRTSVFEWQQIFKKCESRYKTMNGKTALQLPEEKNRRKSFKSVWPKIELLFSDVRRNDRDQ
jgi:uncharacterized protein YecE (DUF72 family)